MRYFACLILILFGYTSFSQGFLKAKDKLIENDNGPILLKGVGLGGWMLQEPYMLQLENTVKAQYDFKNKISTLVGAKNTQKFYDTWLANQCAKADIDSVASWGFNSIRLPLHYNLFTLPIQEEPVANKSTWLKKGFQLTDSLLSWCKADHIYLILDLHAAPGGQGNDLAISDRDEKYPSLWQSNQNKNKTIALWQKLASRYTNEKWIGGYDILNETNWGFDDVNDKHGTAEKSNIPLKKLLTDITAAIRKVDKNHIIIIEGNGWANNYNGIFPLWDDNMAISFHKYWNYTNDASIQNFLDYREKYNVPLWLGETGENSNAWFTDVIELSERNKIGWCMWPLKKAGLNNLLQIKINSGFQNIINYWKGTGKKPSTNEAFNALMEFAKNSKNQNNIFHKDIVDAMLRQVDNNAALPFKQNRIKPNTIIFASDYDLGKSDVAYHDTDSADYWVQTGKRSQWNSGGKYRNDGVDIKYCTDVITNGYSVGWIESGEWLQYSIYCNKDFSYDINIRSSSQQTNGEVQLIVNNNFVGEKTAIPFSPNKNTWQTSTIKNISFSKGWNQLRVLAVNGGYNFNYLQFININNTVKID
jgi:aryl-phospho-beta-D-glucosidase BglC (GH1 family)